MSLTSIAVHVDPAATLRERIVEADDDWGTTVGTAEGAGEGEGDGTDTGTDAGAEGANIMDTGGRLRLSEISTDSLTGTAGTNFAGACVSGGGVNVIWATWG